MKNPMLMRVRYDAGIPLKQLITESTHNEVVGIMIEKGVSHSDRTLEYLKDILPKAFKNEDPKFRFLEALDNNDIMMQLATYLVSVNDAGEVIVTRPTVLRWMLNRTFLFSGFLSVHQELMRVFSRPLYGHAKAEESVAKLLVEVDYDRTLDVMNCAKSATSLGHAAYMALHKAVFVDDPS